MQVEQHFSIANNHVSHVDFLNYLADLPHIKLVQSPKDLSSIESSVNKHFRNFETILHFGTGGSSLGPQLIYNFLDNPKTKVVFFDNIDPDTFYKKMRSCNLETTGVLVVSKSGNTAETLTQLSAIAEVYAIAGHDICEHLMVLTQTDNNALHTYATENNIPIIAHNPNVGGRFSILAEVGQSLSAIIGADMQAFYEGANALLTEIQGDSDHHVLKTAQLLCNQSLNPVHFIYCDRLKTYGEWFAQLWGESLGKVNSNGENIGTTPINAVGATDQHSQLQLYLDGPRDKFISILWHPVLDKSHVMDLKIHHQAYKNLRQANLGKLFEVECQAIFEAMQKNAIPCEKVVLEKLDMFTLGKLVMAGIIKVLYVAKAWQVDPFNQPAVEFGKKRTLELLASAA